MPQRISAKVAGKYQAALRDAQSDLQSQEKQVKALEDQLDRAKQKCELLKGVIQSLIPLSAEEEVDATPGLGNECLYELDQAGELTAPELRDRLAARQVDMQQYSNALAVLHTTLRRLEKRGLVRSKKDEKDGKLRFVFVDEP